MSRHKEDLLKTKPLKNFEHAAVSDIGLERMTNQDAFGHFSSVNGELFVVCDGMGGTELGAEAAQSAVETIGAFIAGEWAEEPAKLIEQALQKANRKVYELSKLKEKTAGTTAVLVLIRQNLMWCAHVGDSRIYYRSGKRFFALTKDHSLVQKMVDKGMISLQEAKVHPERNVVTRSLGLEPEVETEIMEQALQPANGDTILLCTDGLTNELDDDAIEQVLDNDSLSIEAKVSELTQQAKAYGGSDNITVQLIRFFGNPQENTSDKLPKKKYTGIQISGIFKIWIVIPLIILLILAVRYWGVPIFQEKRQAFRSTKNYNAVIIQKPLMLATDSLSDYYGVVAETEDCFALYPELMKIKPSDLMQANDIERMFFRVGEFAKIPKERVNDR